MRPAESQKNVTSSFGKIGMGGFECYDHTEYDPLAQVLARLRSPADTAATAVRRRTRQRRSLATLRVLANKKRA